MLSLCFFLPVIVTFVCLACVAKGQEGTPISLVIEPFDYQHSAYTWNITNSLNYNFSTDALFGDNSLQLTVGKGGTAEHFQGILRNSAHRCHHADYISIWYKAIGDRAGSTNINIDLYSDLSCTLTSSAPNEDCVRPANLVKLSIFDFEVTQEAHSDWQELRMYDVQEHDLRRIKGYKIEVHHTNAEDETQDIPALSIFFDQLACHGDGTMFELLYLDEGQSQTTLYNEGTIGIVHYQSELSASHTSIQLSENGTTYFDYLIEQSEAWGGFVMLGISARGPAYFNLTGATNLVLDYYVTQAASEPSAATMRIVLEDVSDCREDCDFQTATSDPKEHWYSFNNIMDEEGAGQLSIPLEGDTEPGSSFWLTGWAGGIGNSELNLDYIRGMLIELNVDSSLGMGRTVTGAFELSNFHVSSAVITPIDEEDNDRCVLDEAFHVTEGFEQFTKHEYQAHICCEICMQDPQCLFATTSLVGHCYTAPYITPEAVKLTDTVSRRNKVTTVWMDDVVKRGDYCEHCDCREKDQTIDCRGKDLLILPKTFSENWSPKILDLRDNDHLAYIGSESFQPSISTSLYELFIGAHTVHIDKSNFDSMTNLQVLHFDNSTFHNFITETTGAFEDVCCSRGETIQFGTDAALTFCEMKFDSPGIDAVYNEFQHYVNAVNIEAITEESDFMSEAAESAEKCAAYCQINQDCLYFNFDGRIKNSMNVCYLLANQGTETEEVCCNADDYADLDQSQPGWVSGWPAMTRHNLYNARVFLSEQELRADADNNFEVTYDISLGADPLRGAVWIEPSVVGEVDESVNLTITPSRVVLYDSSQAATITVTIHDHSRDTNILIRNNLLSCDEAFTLSDRDAIVIVALSAGKSNEQKIRLAIGYACASIVLLLATAVACKFSTHEDDSLWKVSRRELTFSDPVQVIGRGTFGLVLRAEYRGTAVAVKRVIPPRGTTTSGNQSTDCEDFDTGSFSTESKMAIEMASHHKSVGNSKSSWGYLGFLSQSRDSSWSFDNTKSGFTSSWTSKNILKWRRQDAKTSSATSNWSNMRQQFIEEMSCLSKLRHPCITTVMGAVVEHNAEPMLVMEYMEHGSLYDLLRNETLVIEGELLLPILRDISQGMRFLHSAKPEVIHGDLKAQNILVDSKFRAKVADFGFSHKASLKSTGTPYWMAPELLRGESCNNTATDVYSFGMILYEVYSRNDPYVGEDPEEVLRLIIDKNTRKRPPFPEQAPPQVQGLMAECLRDEPVCRPSFEELDIRLKREDVDAIEPSQPVNNRKETSSKQISVHDIFPKHVADALLEGRTVEPEHRECVTIFFSDIVQFTEISARLEPRKVANLLDRLYTKFDELSQKHDVFKVETIGDAYMAVTNLVKDQPNDHARRIAAFAMDAIEAANGTMIDLDDAEQGVVHIRAGFHCGPVVADVVGTRNPRYCLFGDSVNIASRMESNSKSDRIHCSDTAAEILMTQDPSFPLKSRGKIPIKGKGVLHTYWVNEYSGHRPIELRKKISSHREISIAENVMDISRRSSLRSTTHSTSTRPSGLDDDIPSMIESPPNTPSSIDELDV